MINYWAANMIHISRIVCLLLVSCLLAASDTHLPLTRSRLNTLARFSQSQGGSALLVLEKGRLRIERYRNKRIKLEPQNLMSGAKNFIVIAVLQAAEEGLLDLDEFASASILEWRSDLFKSKIRIRDLLRCSSGLDPATHILQSRSCSDKYATALQVESLNEPGVAFAYGPSHYLVIAEVLHRKLAKRGELLPDFLLRRILSPLKLDLDTWRMDLVGNLIPFAGLSLKPRDWLLFGRMLEARGSLGGKSLLGVRSLTEALTPSPTNRAYGLGFWLNAEASNPEAIEADVERWISEPVGSIHWQKACLSRNAPTDLFACIGSGGQRLYIVPSRQMVIVHLGRCKGFRDAEFLDILFNH